jgi:hypothetical protein
LIESINRTLFPKWIDTKRATVAGLGIADKSGSAAPLVGAVELQYPCSWCVIVFVVAETDLDNRFPRPHAARFNSLPYTTFDHSPMDVAVVAIYDLDLGLERRAGAVR